MGEMADYYLEQDENRWLDGCRGADEFEGDCYHEMLWTCKDGTKILITDMTDNHLLNSKRMMERNGTDTMVEYDRICEEISNRKGAGKWTIAKIIESKGL